VPCAGAQGPHAAAQYIEYYRAASVVQARELTFSVSEDLLVRVKDLATQCRALSNTRAELRAKAQSAIHDTPAREKFLQMANAITPNLSEALSRYHEAVVEFLRSKR